MEKLLLIDGNSIMNRAFYGVRPLTNAAGLHTNAVFGYVNILKKHLDALDPDYCAVAFDVHAPTFRHRMYDGYKATRHPMPEELKEQVPYVKRVTGLLGFLSVEKEGYEADDVLGTLSRAASREGVSVYIVTGDRDSLQLVGDKVTVILASTGADVEYTPEVFREKYGTDPERLVDIKAIMGDSSDNIPGVKGLGEKGALTLIQTFGDLRGVYQNLDSPVIKPAMKKKLEESRDMANLSYRLATIDRDVAGLPATKELARRGFDVPGLREIFGELEFTRMLSAFTSQAPADKKADGEGGGQLSFDDVGTEPEEPKRDIKTVGASELKALLLGKPFGYFGGVFSLDGKLYRPEGDPLPLLTDPGLNRSMGVFDLKGLAEKYAVKDAPCGIFAGFDALLAAYLVNPSDSISIKSLLWIYARCDASPQQMEDPDFMLARLDRLRPVLEEKLEALGSGKLYSEIELPLAVTLAEMEAQGFGVDREELIKYGATLRARISEVEEKIYSLCGQRFNLNSPKQLGKVLFEDLGLPAPKKTRTGYTTDAQTLEKLADDHPAIELILEYRALSKLNGTYAEGLLKAIDPADGRIHTRFNQTQTATGRLSSLEPNLQNIPVRTPLGRELRRFFVADKGKVLVDADYSQIELRLLAHLSGDEALIDAFERGEDIHARTASEIFGVPMEKVTPQMRKEAKAINFGIIYGMGAYTLSQDIKVSRATAARYIDGYFAAYPKVAGYLGSLVEGAKANGWVATLFGRRRYVPELSASRKSLAAFGERVARNTPIQGTAADIIKLAMVKVESALRREGLEARLIMQVHDELIIEAPESEGEKVRELLTREMENAVKLKVKLVADAQIGRSWYDCH